MSLRMASGRIVLLVCYSSIPSSFPFFPTNQPENTITLLVISSVYNFLLFFRFFLASRVLSMHLLSE